MPFDRAVSFAWSDAIGAGVLFVVGVVFVLALLALLAPLFVLICAFILLLISTRLRVAFGIALVTLAFIMLLTWLAPAGATWKPQDGKEPPPAVRNWFAAQAIATPSARKRLDVYLCCNDAERLRTKFKPRADGNWSYYPDPNCVTDGCPLAPIPSDVEHQETIRALDPKDDGLPEFEEMRREGVLMIYHGQPSCFWAPEPGI